MAHSIEKQFTLVSSTIYQLHDYITTNNTDQDKVNKLIVNGIKLAQKFKAFTGKPLHAIHIDAFIEGNKGELYRVHEILVGEIQRLFLDKHHTENARTCHDIIFGAINIKVPRKRFASLPTQLCQEFCKGITYFENDGPILESPFYHRKSSCGTKTKQASEKFKHDATKEYVRRCYLERLIYDQIYTHTLHFQDIGHEYELKVIEQLYQKFFSYSSIDVRIKYRDMIYPINVMIIHSTPNGVVIEQYSKNKSKHVLCKKEHGGITYEKIQTFEHEESWMTGGQSQ